MNYRTKERRDTRLIFGACAVVWLAAGVGTLADMSAVEAAPSQITVTFPHCRTLQVNGVTYTPGTRIATAAGLPIKVQHGTYNPMTRTLTLNEGARVFCSTFR